MIYGRWARARRAMGRATLALVGTVLFLAMLTGCGGSGNSPTTTQPFTAAQIQLVGQPTAHISTGTTVQVSGQVKNTDTKRHDIFLQATLKDTSGATVGIATGKAEDVVAGTTVPYTLTGTVTQPSWATVTVVVTKITENTNGSGGD